MEETSLNFKLLIWKSIQSPVGGESTQWRATNAKILLLEKKLIWFSSKLALFNSLVWFPIWSQFRAFFIRTTNHNDNTGYWTKSMQRKIFQSCELRLKWGWRLTRTQLITWRKRQQINLFWLLATLDGIALWKRCIFVLTLISFSFSIHRFIVTFGVSASSFVDRNKSEKISSAQICCRFVKHQSSRKTIWSTFCGC